MSRGRHTAPIRREETSKEIKKKAVCSPCLQIAMHRSELLLGAHRSGVQPLHFMLAAWGVRVRRKSDKVSK